MKIYKYVHSIEVIVACSYQGSEYITKQAGREPHQLVFIAISCKSLFVRKASWFIFKSFYELLVAKNINIVFFFAISKSYVLWYFFHL